MREIAERNDLKLAASNGFLMLLLRSSTAEAGVVLCDGTPFVSAI